MDFLFTTLGKHRVYKHVCRVKAKSNQLTLVRTCRLLLTKILPVCTLGDTDEFETLDLVPYSNPPELPDVMKPTDSSTTNQVEQPVS